MNGKSVRRLVLVIGLTLATVSTVSVPAAAQLKATVTSFGPGIHGHKEATVHVQNSTGKVITALDISLRLKTSTGRVITSRAAGVNFAHPGSGAIFPGAGYDLVVPIEADVIEVSAGKVKAVVYGDLTATGDEDSIQSFTRERLQFALQAAQDAAAYPSVEASKNAQAAADYAKIRRVQ